MEEIRWKQKSRVLRLKEGDKNTNSFHKTAIMREKINAIEKLKVGGVWCMRRIWRLILWSSKALYSEPCEFKLRLEGTNFSRIYEENNSWLVRSFTEQEVLAVLNGLKEDKVPGPDRF